MYSQFPLPLFQLPDMVFTVLIYVTFFYPIATQEIATTCPLQILLHRLHKSLHYSLGRSAVVALPAFSSCALPLLPPACVLFPRLLCGLLFVGLPFLFGLLGVCMPWPAYLSFVSAIYISGASVRC